MLPYLPRMIWVLLLDGFCLEGRYNNHATFVFNFLSIT